MAEPSGPERPDPGMDDFARRLAAPEPTPGGGAAGARAGLHAAALIAMVASITLRRARGEEGGSVTGELEAVLRRAEGQTAAFSRLEAADIEAFEGYLAASRLPRASDSEKERRREARCRAAEEAARVPLETLEASLEVLALARRLLDLSSRVLLGAASDLGAAVELAHAAFRTAEWTVRANLPAMASSSKLAELHRRWERARDTLAREYPGLRRAVLGLLGG